MASVTLRATQAVLSIINPQTNQYMPYGRMVVIAIRKNTTIAIVALAQNKKPVIAVQATPDIQWALQNMVYCSFVSGGHRGLFQFSSGEEAELFTAFALSGKLAQLGGYLCIDPRQGPPLNPDLDIKVNYKCYDLQSKKIDGPVMDEQDYVVSSSDSTHPLRSITKGGTAGSTFLVAFPHDIVGVVHSISETADLPMFGGAAKKTDDVSEGSSSKKRKKSKKGADTSDADTSESAPSQPPPQPQQVVQPVQPIYRGPPPPNSVQPNSMYDSQLESIRNEMQSKFSELSQMVASLRRTQASLSNIPLASDILVSSVQRLLKENQIKDQQIAEKRQLLDILNARQSDTRERDSLRIQLAELGSRLSAQRQKTRNANAEQDGLSKKIQELQAELSLKRVNAESSINDLRTQLEEDKMSQVNELKKQREEITNRAKKADEELAKVREDFEKALAENKRLKEMTSKDKTQELHQLQKKLPTVMSNAVRGMVMGVFKLIAAKFDEDEDYDGETIKKEIRAAMQRQANLMLEVMEQNEIDQDADDDEEEEEDEDEQ